MGISYSPISCGRKTWPCFTAYVSWKGSNQHVYNGNTIMRSDSWDLPVRGPFAAFVKSVHTTTALSLWLSLHVVPIYMIQANSADSQGASITPSGSFPEPPFISPPLALSKSSLPFSSGWEQVKWEIELRGIWPVWFHPLFFFSSHETHKRERESKSRSVPSWESDLCLFSSGLCDWKHTSVLSLIGDRGEAGNDIIHLSQQTVSLCSDCPL